MLEWDCTGAGVCDTTSSRALPCTSHIPRLQPATPSKLCTFWGAHSYWPKYQWTQDRKSGVLLQVRVWPRSSLMLPPNQCFSKQIYTCNVCVLISALDFSISLSIAWQVARAPISLPLQQKLAVIERWHPSR